HRAGRGRAPQSRPPREALLPARARRQGRPPAREARHSDPHDGPRALAGPASAVPPPSAPYHFEARAWRTGVVRVAGVDEAGRGTVAAASIIAKVTRDRIMLDVDGQFPEYGFARHKGYATAEHLAALDRHGPCPLHRRSFISLWKQGELFPATED